MASQHVTYLHLVRWEHAPFPDDGLTGVFSVHAGADQAQVFIDKVMPALANADQNNYLTPKTDDGEVEILEIAVPAGSALDRWQREQDIQAGGKNMGDFLQQAFSSNRSAYAQALAASETPVARRGFTLYPA